MVRSTVGWPACPVVGCAPGSSVCPVHLFAYGSNMSTARMRARAPSARVVAVAALPAHRLRFHKVGMDGSAKCDAQYTGERGDQVFGVVYALAGIDKARLDAAEGLGDGYDEKQVEVHTDRGRMAASMYFATRVDGRLRPFSWYRRHVLTGAREHDLPADYVERIEAAEAVEDADTERSRRELGVHRP